MTDLDGRGAVSSETHYHACNAPCHFEQEVRFPEIKEGLVVRPGDTVVFTLHDRSEVDTAEKVDDLVRRIKGAMPKGTEIVLLDGMTMGVIRREGAA